MHHHRLLSTSNTHSHSYRPCMRSQISRHLSSTPWNADERPPGRMPPSGAEVGVPGAEFDVEGGHLITSRRGWPELARSVIAVSTGSSTSPYMPLTAKPWWHSRKVLRWVWSPHTASFWNQSKQRHSVHKRGAYLSATARRSTHWTRRATAWPPSFPVLWWCVHNMHLFYRKNT